VFEWSTGKFQKFRRKLMEVLKFWHELFIRTKEISPSVDFFFFGKSNYIRDSIDKKITSHYNCQECCGGKAGGTCRHHRRVVSAGVGKCHMALVKPVDMVFFLLILVGGGSFYQFARTDGLIC
jgi:hypothetical protein